MICVPRNLASHLLSRPARRPQHTLTHAAPPLHTLKTHNTLLDAPHALYISSPVTTFTVLSRPASRMQHTRRLATPPYHTLKAHNISLTDSYKPFRYLLHPPLCVLPSRLQHSLRLVTPPHHTTPPLQTLWMSPTHFTSSPVIFTLLCVSRPPARKTPPAHTLQMSSTHFMTTSDTLSAPLVSFVPFSLPLPLQPNVSTLKSNNTPLTYSLEATHTQT